MRDIRLPEISDKFIDISDINENTSGIILAQIVVLNVMKICQHY